MHPDTGSNEQWDAKQLTSLFLRVVPDILESTGWSLRTVQKEFKIGPDLAISSSKIGHKMATTKSNTAETSINRQIGT